MRQRPPGRGLRIPHDAEVAARTKRVIDALHDLALRQPFDRLSQSVFDMAGQVEVVGGPAANRLAKHGSIAALSRY